MTSSPNTASRFLWLAGAMALALLAGCAPDGDPGAVVLRRDGMVAEIRTDEEQLDMAWRFQRPLIQPLSAITADVHGRPLGAPTFSAYPQPGNRSAFLIVMDVSDPRREQELRADKVIALSLLATLKPYHSVGLMTYASAPDVMPPHWQDLSDLGEDIAGIALKDEKPDRDGALLKAVLGVGSIPANRRALFVFTDGHTTTPDNAAEVVTAAYRYGVAVTFVTAPSTGLRPADTDMIEAIAGLTGGEVIGAAEVRRFQMAPFALLDSGGRATFPLAGAYRLPWESSSAVHVRMTFGEQAADFDVPARLPPADLRQILMAAWPALAVLAAVLVLAGILALVIRRRHRKAAPPAKAAPSARTKVAPAWLEPIGGGPVYPLDRDEIRLGRDASTNDIVLADPTVSRRHAVIRRTPTGSLLIANVSSTNGIQVNGREVNQIVLAANDVIRLGDVELTVRQDSRPGVA